MIGDADAVKFGWVNVLINALCFTMMAAMFLITQEITSIKLYTNFWCAENFKVKSI